jgi:hypothetical protein
MDGSSTSADVGAPDATHALDAPRDVLDAPSRGCDGASRTLRTLFVGNSQIDFWNLHQLVSDFSDLAPESCARIEGSRFTMGGANLTDLSVATIGGRTLDQALASGDFDAVVLAESIDLVDFRPPYPEQFVTVATSLIQTARAHGVTPYLYASPYVDAPNHAGFHEQADPQLALGATSDVRVAAGGLAWLRVWAERPDMDLHFSDRAHPNYKGSVISAMEIWSVLTGGDPTVFQTNPEIWCDSGPCPPVPVEELSLFSRAARDEADATGR